MPHLDHINQCKPRSSYFLGNGDDVGYPIRVLFLPDETGVNKLLDFRPDYFHYFWTELSLLLFDWFHIQIDVEAMHSHLRVNPGHILLVPGENINILSHKIY